MIRRKTLFAVFVSCTWAFSLIARGNAQTMALKPLPLYEQCASLTEGANEALKRDLAALKSADAIVRAEAVRQLSKACRQQAVEPLVDLLRSESVEARLAAIETLGRLGAPDSVESLRDLTGDPDWRVRLALVPALASFKAFQARNAVLNAIFMPTGVDVSDEDDMRVRCIAMLTLNQMTDVTFSRKSVQGMTYLLNSKRPNIRQMAEQTMYALKDTRNGVNELIGILKQHNTPEMRRWACEWLGKLGIERARPTLEDAAANDKNPAVKNAAVEALAKLQRTAKQ
jgi:HEAT repeat protein